MCLVPLECVCLLCKFGAFSEILGIKISKFSRGSIPPDPSRNRSQLHAHAKAARAFGVRSAKLIAIVPWLKFYPGYGPGSMYNFSVRSFVLAFQRTLLAEK